MAPWLSPAAPKRVSGELRLSDGAETASSVAGAYCLITPDALLTRWYPANFLRWGNRIFTDEEQMRWNYHQLVADELGDPEGVLRFDETGFGKKGKDSVGFARQVGG